MTNLYKSMRVHPDIAPIMDLLDLVEPCDEFSRALCLVRDCFEENNTLRHLSRRSLRALLKERTSLMTVYEMVVMKAATTTGAKPTTFLEAASALPADEFDKMREVYRRQVAEVMGRPL